MEVNKKYRCELGGEVFDDPASVRDSVDIINGEDSRHFNEVCAKCLKKLVGLIDDNFERNKYF